MEYPGTIQKEHMKEVKWDHFYEGLSPKYQWMVSQVNGENPDTYSELLLAAQKLERWVEAKDPLLQKTTSAGSLNIPTHKEIYFHAGS